MIDAMHPCAWGMYFVIVSLRRGHATTFFPPPLYFLLDNINKSAQRHFFIRCAEVPAMLYIYMDIYRFRFGFGWFLLCLEARRIMALYLLPTFMDQV